MELDALYKIYVMLAGVVGAIAAIVGWFIRLELRIQKLMLMDERQADEIKTLFAWKDSH